MDDNTQEVIENTEEVSNEENQTEETGTDDVGTTQEENDQENQEETGETTEDTGEEQESESKESEKVKLKIDGEEKEFTQDEVYKMAQKFAGADKAFKEASEVREQTEKIFNALKSDPVKVLNTMGINFDELATQYLYDKLNYENMSEEEKKVLDQDKKLKQLEEENKTFKQQQEELKLQQESEKYIEEYTKQINGALEKSILPVNDYTVRRVATHMSNALATNTEMTAEQAVEKVLNEYKDDISHLTSLEQEKLDKLMGEEFIKKLRQYDISRIKEKQGKVKKESNENPIRSKRKKKKLFSEFQKELHDMVENIED